MKLVLGLVVLAVGAHAMTIVTVSTPEPKVEASVGGSAELKCEFDIQPNSTQPPTIAWFKSTDFARYWCTVAEWGARTELGVDAKSVLLTETGHSQHAIDISVSGEREVEEGADVEMTCQCHGCHYPTFDWFKVG
ncbi:uncharacterized protein LOC118432464 [Branchiostoma floridae]|uniref:Uncharacterized protein LOC118432464 n=1 Tax=Branchiostoma floridae TaxID=7739 RepID=A0A9J7MGZ3_BRAFL|nr:uncharacterized protein LOC118432464 [Branchiostoma floridae]